MTKFNHLNQEQRDLIQFSINSNLSINQLAKAINKDRTTISKEIKRNSYIKDYYNDDIFSDKNKKQVISNCSKLSKYPFVCNKCFSKNHCNKRKIYYHSNIAQKRYKETLSICRKGVDIKPEIVDIIETSIVPLIKNKKQSINQIYHNHSDILYFSKTTFYKYVNLGVLSLNNTDLPRKVSYKPRKQKNSTENKRNLALLKNRTYEDYLDFILKYNTHSIVEMDTVIGKRDDQKCLLTITIKDSKFVLIRLLENKTMQCVNNAINDIKQKLGSKLFKQVFRLILTDNGSEFFNPTSIECNLETGEKLVNVFYCKPYSSWQKGTCEKNHEYIRYILNKNTSFEKLTDKIVKNIEDNINNIPRDILNGKTPFEVVKEKYPELIEKLNCSCIKPDDVSLNKNDYFN